MRASLLSLLVTLLLGLLGVLPGSSPPGVDAVCAQARVRRNYDTLTTTERQTYRDAIQVAMDRGHYIKFVEMHMEKMSEMEAHGVCMFTYWHRYFLIGFENMLRSLDPRFECVTIPYWDEMQQNARQMTGACKSIESCALIVRDMGGSSIGTKKSVTINGGTVSGDLCVRAAPFTHFCQSSDKAVACAKCLPRDNLKLRSFPAEASFAVVHRNLFKSGDLASTSSSIERSIHNTMHAMLGATMGTLQSPADPLFWSHHAYIDLLLTIYLKCRVGLNMLTDEQKKTNAYTFAQCPQRDGVSYFTTSSTVTMRSGEAGKTPTRVDQSAGQPLFPFFQGVPTKYYQLSDISQLGANRYTYRVSGLVGQMAAQCDAATGKLRRLRRGCSSDLEEETPDFQQGFEIDHSDDKDKSAKKVNAWVAEVRGQLGRVDDQHAADQLQTMVCMFYDQCRGGVNDFSDEFKKAFNVKEPPPCKRIVDAMKAVNATSGMNGTDASTKITLPDWKQRMIKYFPCDAAPAYGRIN